MLDLQNNQRQQGFTLIELMIAITLLGILLSIALPSYRSFIQNSRIRNAAESISNGLQVARAEAVKRNAPVQFKLQVDSSWSVGCTDVTAECPEIIQSRSSAEGSSDAIVITPENGDTIEFDYLGRMTAPALVAPATTARFGVDINPDVLSAEESRDLRVIIGLGGSVRLCDPNLANDSPMACP